MSTGRPESDASFNNLRVAKKATASERLTAKTVEAQSVVADEVVSLGPSTSGAVVTDSFTLATGAADGFVLTSDASGVGTWQQSGGETPAAGVTISAVDSGIATFPRHFSGQLVGDRAHVAFIANTGAVDISAGVALFTVTPAPVEATTFNFFRNGTSAIGTVATNGEVSVNTVINTLDATLASYSNSFMIRFAYNIA